MAAVMMMVMMMMVLVMIGSVWGLLGRTEITNPLVHHSRSHQVPEAHSRFLKNLEPHSRIQKDLGRHTRSSKVPETFSRSYKALEAHSRSFKNLGPYSRLQKYQGTQARSYKAAEAHSRSYKVPEPFSRSYKVPEPYSKLQKDQRAQARSYKAAEAISRSYKVPEPFSRSYKVPKPYSRLQKHQRAQARSYKAVEAHSRSYKVTEPYSRFHKASEFRSKFYKGPKSNAGFHKDQRPPTSKTRSSRSVRSDATKEELSDADRLTHLDWHDYTLRPAFAGPPISVAVDVQIESIDSISEVDMDFTMTLYLRHYWVDDRLAFPTSSASGSPGFSSASNRSRTFDGRLLQRIWAPDVFFVHSKRSFIHDSTTDNVMLRVHPDGSVLYSLRVTVTSMCSMDFSRFPLDSQNCSLELESYAYTLEDLRLHWKRGDASLSTDDDISLSQFLIRDFRTASRTAYYSSTGHYNRLYIIFTLSRHIHFFLLQTYFPSALMVMLSWVSFWIDRRAVPARVPLGITTVLTMSTIITGVNASMPRVSYVKAVDVYLWMSFVFVFLSVLEYAVINYLSTAAAHPDGTAAGGDSAKEKLSVLCACTVQPPYPAGDSFDLDLDLDLDFDPSNAVNTMGMVISSSSPGRSLPQRSTVSPSSASRNRRDPQRDRLDAIGGDFPLSDPCDRDAGRDAGCGCGGGGASRGGPAAPPRRPAPPSACPTHAIDSYSRALFPAAFLLFNVAYWAAYCD